MFRTSIISNFKRLCITNDLCNASSIRALSTTTKCLKAEDRREMLASLPAKDEGTEGEKAVDIDNLINK